jgi:hypothetical protein
MTVIILKAKIDNYNKKIISEYKKAGQCQHEEEEEGLSARKPTTYQCAMMTRIREKPTRVVQYNRQ